MVLMLPVMRQLQDKAKVTAATRIERLRLNNLPRVLCPAGACALREEQGVKCVFMWLLESRHVCYNPRKISYKYAVKLPLEPTNGQGSPQA